MTAPCFTVFVDSLKPNSVGLPAVTVTVVAVVADQAAAVSAEAAIKAASPIQAVAIRDILIVPP